MEGPSPFYLSLCGLLFTFLIVCGLQKPAPIMSFKNKKLYSRSDLRDIQKQKAGEKNLNKKKDYDNTKNNRKTAYRFIMPIDGKVISHSSADEMCRHGIKIASGTERGVVASASGKVIYIGKGVEWYGNLVIIAHKNDYITIYSYLRKMYVGIGSIVKQGQLIGSAGKSNEGLQICFTMRKNGQAIDPLLYID